MDIFTLVLLRHGQSIWNLENRFTGWIDVPLTDYGVQEARAAAHQLERNGFSFDIAYTSPLRRSWESLQIVQDIMGLRNIPTIRAWELNERHYGCLQGLNKTETAVRLGEDRVMHWRRSLHGRPPMLELDDHRHPRFDPLFADLPAEKLPRTESLADTASRLMPYWEAEIAPAIRSGRRVLIVAHGNSLRALVQYLESVPEIDVPSIQIPTGIPIIYRMGLDLQPISREDAIPG